jgi:hypothetical protein
VWCVRFVWNNFLSLDLFTDEARMSTVSNQFICRKDFLKDSTAIQLQSSRRMLEVKI